LNPGLFIGSGLNRRRIAGPGDERERCARIAAFAGLELGTSDAINVEIASVPKKEPRRRKVVARANELNLHARRISQIHEMLAKRDSHASVILPALASRAAYRRKAGKTNNARIGKYAGIARQIAATAANPNNIVPVARSSTAISPSANGPLFGSDTESSIRFAQSKYLWNRAIRAHRLHCGFR